jgi:hypothetical protein
MAGVWWYLPRESRQFVCTDDQFSRSALRRHGLDRVLEDVRLVPDHCLVMDLAKGPDDGPGVLLYPIPVSGDIPKKPGYHADGQAWHKSAVGPWLGYDRESPPTPADLERRILIGGYPITDGHGQPWQVPVLRAVDNPRGRLSAAFSWDEQDRPSIGVDPRYAELWDQSARVWDLIDLHSQADGAVFAQDFDAETDQFLLTFVLDCLQINYRANNAVFSALNRARPGWLTQSVASWMLNATVDLFKYKQFLDAQKKTPS